MFRSALVVVFAGLLLAVSAGSGRADGDPVKGKRVFIKCKTCHELTAKKNKIGPYLVGVIGRKSASVPGYNYSTAMKKADVVWDEKTLDVYLANPRKLVPGTKMTLAPLTDPKERADVIAYIKQEMKQ